MKTHEFTLVLSGIDEISTEIEDALHEAGCDDALLGVRSGVPFLDFDREAEDFGAAVLSAIRDVGASGTGLRVVRVEPDDLVNASEIARRLGRTRESVRLLIAGARGPGGFPPPVSNLKGTSPIRSWAAVAEWCLDHRIDDAVDSIRCEEARFVARLNATLGGHSGG
jgi:hypothetical protein